jgi:hypothetical protein
LEIDDHAHTDNDAGLATKGLWKCGVLFFLVV